MRYFTHLHTRSLTPSPCAPWSFVEIYGGFPETYDEDYFPFELP